MLGQLAGAREAKRRFSVGKLDSLIKVFGLPTIANLNAPLGRLRCAGLVERYDGEEPWMLTPEGHERVRQVIGHLPLEQIEAELAETPGAFMASVPHRVIPPSLAPPRWITGISRLLERHPFETNVFCMTRYPASGDSEGGDAVATALPALRATLAQHGLTMHLASDRQLDDDLLGNVGAYMWACQYGIGILEDRAQSGLNYNVVIELGAMIVTGRRCAILKDTSAPSLPTDFVGQIYKPVDLANADDVAEQIAKWVEDDLGLRR